MSTHFVLVTHAALVALTPLVPLPVVDEWARRKLERRLWLELAARHGRALSEVDLTVLTATSTEGILDGAAVGRRLLVMPFTWVFKRVMLALRGKAVVEAASLAFHRAQLCEASLRRDLVATYGPDRVRDAIDTTIADVPIAASPVTAAVRTGLRASRVALARTFARLHTDAARSDGQREDMYARAVAAMRDQNGLTALAARLAEVPARHRDRLERRFVDRLTGAGA
ncbi:MAG: hypothetical protein AAF715_10360 [Myxococcota bacterium]